MEYFFRAKRLDCDKFVNGYLKDANIILNDREYLIDPCTIGQFTGKYDVNGARIFSGDILKIKSGFFTFGYCMVIWDEKRFRFSLKTKQYYYPMYDSFTYEVVGNTYDNSELLKMLGR